MFIKCLQIKCTFCLDETLPNVSLTTDGGAAPYEHGGTEHAVATLSLAGIPAEDIPDMEDTEPDYELLSDEEIEALFSI